MEPGFVVTVVTFKLARIAGASTTASNVISWIIAVTLLYILNKFWVFKSKTKNKKDGIKELLSFFSARIVTLLMEIVIVYIFVDILKFNDLVIKIISQIIVIISNYFFSKLWIFKKKEETKEKESKEL